MSIASQFGMPVIKDILLKVESDKEISDSYNPLIESKKYIFLSVSLKDTSEIKHNSFLGI